MASIVQALKLFRTIRELRGLTPHEKLMLYTLASIGESDGTNIHPGHAYLAACTMLAERTVRRLLDNLETKGYLKDDGRVKYVRRYRLNLPGITPKILTTPDISKEEWESMWEPEADDTPTEKRPAIKPLDDDTTVKVPVVKPPLPETPDERYEKALNFIWDCICLAKQRKAGMTYERVLVEARRKGIPRDEVDWLWENYEEDVGKTDSPSSQRGEPGPITNIPSGTYQP